VINEGDFKDKASFEANLREDDLWIQLPTAQGGRAWVLFSDAMETDGIIESAIEGYDIANDIPDPAELTLRGVSFVSGSAELTEDSMTILDDIADKLWLLGDLKFEVAGYTDSIGSSASNQRLSLQRAEAVVAHWVSRGIDAARLSAVGYGEANPIADNGTAEGRALNRRVELRQL